MYTMHNLSGTDTFCENFEVIMPIVYVIMVNYSTQDVKIV